MKTRLSTAAAALWIVLSALSCENDDQPTRIGGPATGPTTSSTVATVQFVFRGITARRTDLPASTFTCVQGVGATHIHPSWREFAAIPLTPVPPERYEITFNDVPVGSNLTFRINDQNWCDRNETGAVLSGVSANGVDLTQNAVTPGNGSEPGFAFTVDSAGRVRQ